MHHPAENLGLPFESFRCVIEAIADLVCCQGFNPEENSVIRIELLARGFEIELIREGENWCARAATSSSLVEVLSVFATESKGLRIDSPLERVFVSDRMWKTIENCRKRGIFSLDMTERLLEGLRAMDTRDWDDHEVREFIQDACSNPFLVGSVDKKLRKALKGDFADYYC